MWRKIKDKPDRFPLLRVVGNGKGLISGGRVSKCCVGVSMVKWDQERFDPGS